MPQINGPEAILEVADQREDPRLMREGKWKAACEVWIGNDVGILSYVLHRLDSYEEY